MSCTKDGKMRMRTAIRSVWFGLLAILLAACAQSQTAPSGPTEVPGVRVTLNAGGDPVSVFAPHDWSSNDMALVNDANRDVLMTVSRSPGLLDGMTLDDYVSELANTPGAEVEYYDSGDKRIAIIRITGDDSRLLAAHVGLANGDLVYLAVVDFSSTAADLSAYEPALRQVAESVEIPSA
jgi:hypothetical protein